MKECGTLSAGARVSRARAFVRLDEIVVNADFAARKGAKDRAHIRTLAQSVKNHGALDPLLLWKNEAGSLVLLDGAYRLAAYRATGWQHDVPANVVTCDRRTALLLAAGANTKDKLSLSPTEKADLAWKLVREPGMKFSKPEIAKATGISTATVARMRARFKTLSGLAEVEITGSWFRDRQNGMDDEWDRIGSLSDAERNKAIEVLAKSIRDLIDRRKPGAVTRDSDILFEALHTALGAQQVRAFADWIFGGRDEELDEWGAIGIDDEVLEGDDGPVCGIDF